MHLCKQNITVITISFIIIITVLETKLINNIKQNNDHRVTAITPILVPSSIQYTYVRPLIIKYILKRWQDIWDQQMHNLLHGLHSIVGN